MVAFGHTDTAQRAVFAASGLLKPTCTADMTGSEEDVVVRITSHSLVMVEGRNVVGGSNNTEIGKNIWSGQKKRNR